MFENYSDIVSVMELCKMLRIGKNAAYDLIKTEQIKSVRVGKAIKIPKKFVVEFVCKQN